MTLIAQCLDVQPFWHPSDIYQVSASGAPTPAQLTAWWNSGVRSLRVTVPAEGFLASPKAAWSIMLPTLSAMRARGFGVQLALYSDQRDGGKGRYESNLLIETYAGRRSFAEGAVMLVELGQASRLGFSYDLFNETKLPGDLCSELNFLLFSHVRKVSANALLSLGLPMYQSPDQAPNTGGWGDKYCDLSVHWYFAIPPGQQADAIVINPALDQVALARADFAPVMDLAARTGLPPRVTEWGVDLRLRNDGVTTTVLKAAAQVLSENGLMRTAAYWTDQSLFSGAVPIAMAPASAIS